MIRLYVKNVLLALSLALVSSYSYAEVVKKIIVKGNLKVESSAIKSILITKEGRELNSENIAEDIRAIFDLGFFSDIRVYKAKASGGASVTFQVVEKPSIIGIEYEGLEEVTKDDLEEKLNTKLYTILDESVISSDLRVIEKAYAEKGFYLAKASYDLEEINENEVKVVFRVQENGKILVGDVHIIGNRYFTDSQLTEQMATRPTTRSAVIGSSSLYQENFVKRDVEFLAYFYRDFGFAEVKVAKAQTEISSDREFVDVTFTLEEGPQYRVGNLSISGDEFFPEDELIEEMEIKEGGIFKISSLRKDVDALIDKYGDLGYAYVDVNPKTSFNKKDNLVNLDFAITKGPKVYFGYMQVTGNTKTRDNVIRRELEIGDGDLYSRIGLRESKQGIERLGFFESVQVVKERDKFDQNKINLKINVKEKPTGQLQAALGYTPSGDTAAAFFGQGRYEEKNQSGKGWNVSATGKTDGKKNYNLNLAFGDPRVNDSLWSFGFNVGYEHKTLISYGIDVSEERKSAGIRVGRNLFEMVRGSIGLTYSDIVQTTDEYLDDIYTLDGNTFTTAFNLTRRVVDNYIDPTEGTGLLLRHAFITGDYEYMESTAAGKYYVPIYYTDTYKTHFKFNLELGQLLPFKGSAVPISERYKLGGANSIRGYPANTITPTFALWRTPFDLDSSSAFPKGGDRKFLFQAEYYMPLIPQAGIKGLLFFDIGKVYDNQDQFDLVLKDMKKDIGFGIRWVTPVAPFRFEWAFPIDEDGNLGDHELIFNIGY